MRTLLAEIFRLLFKIDFFKKRHFGIHTKIIKPLGLFKGVKRRINYKGFQIELHIEDWIQENIYFLGDYEKAELQVLEHLLKPGDIFVDVGANFGLYTINAAKIIKENGHIFSFEPFSQSFNALKKNIIQNNIVQITFENKAVGEKSGNLDLYYDPKSTNLGSVSANYLENGVNETVKVVALDDYFEHQNNLTIKMIKIDVEGFEYAVLLGMKNILTHQKPILLIEIFHESQEKIHGYLAELGYQKYYIDDNGNLSQEAKNCARMNFIYAALIPSNLYS
ncbi:MAG: FkbM family methyltransferase [Crocinitomicaceae bacterium]|nr:FkbM family methyltransferase [Crocinitomicaceae bacterium]